MDSKFNQRYQYYKKQIDENFNNIIVEGKITSLLAGGLAAVSLLTGCRQNR